MKQTKELAKPENYQIPQTVTSPVERREIRNFIGMRLKQIKARLDRIYRFRKEQYVAAQYEKKAQSLTGKPELVELVKQYNKDNPKIKTLLAQKDSIIKQLERLCDAKQRASEKLEDYAGKEDDLSYSASTYGNIIDKHGKKTIEPEGLLAETTINDKIKADFDTINSKQMEKRNRKLNYLNEKIEERLLFGKREQIQKLFCELEKMNAIIEQELVRFGIDNGIEPEEGA